MQRNVGRGSSHQGFAGDWFGPLSRDQDDGNSRGRGSQLFDPANRGGACVAGWGAGIAGIRGKCFALRQLGDDQVEGGDFQFLQ